MRITRYSWFTWCSFLPERKWMMINRIGEKGQSFGASPILFRHPEAALLDATQRAILMADAMTARGKSRLRVFGKTFIMRPTVSDD